VRYALLLLAACGRIGFADHAATDAVVATDGAPDATADATSAVTITYAGPFAERHPGGGITTDTFTATAKAAGDVIPMQLGCGSSTKPTGVTISGAGWTFHQLTQPAGVSPLWTSRIVAVAPDTAPVAITVTWAGSPCEIGTSTLADEFSGVNSSVTFGIVAGGNNPGNGNCTDAVTTSTPNEAVWAACFAASAVTGVGPGYLMGADSGGGDWAEYRISADPAGTLETPTFANIGAYLEDVLTLRSN